MILRKNPIDASYVIPLLAWKFFCNPSTSPSFVSETRNNNRHIVFWTHNIFQCILQARYLHNLTFNSPNVIKQLSFTSLMTSLKFVDEQQDLLIYKWAKGNFSRWNTRAVIVTQTSWHFLRHPVLSPIWSQKTPRNSCTHLLLPNKANFGTREWTSGVLCHTKFLPSDRYISSDEKSPKNQQKTAMFTKFYCLGTPAPTFLPRWGAKYGI